MHAHRHRCQRFSQNDVLRKKLKETKSYVDAVSAKGWIGKDDPLFQNFIENINVYVPCNRRHTYPCLNTHSVLPFVVREFRHEKRVALFCSANISTGASQGVIQRVLTTIGLTRDELWIKLEFELRQRTSEEVEIGRLLASIKVAIFFSSLLFPF